MSQRLKLSQFKRVLTVKDLPTLLLPFPVASVLEVSMGIYRYIHFSKEWFILFLCVHVYVCVHVVRVWKDGDSPRSIP